MLPIDAAGRRKRWTLGCSTTSTTIRLVPATCNGRGSNGGMLLSMLLLLLLLDSLPAVVNLLL